jgi:hypothetical protein
MSKIKFDAEDVLKLFSKMEKRINDLECFIQKCCDKIPINVGNGAGLFKKYFNGHWQFKSILAGTNVTVTEQDNTITINSTSESITCEDINDCLGISEAGQANKFLNEQGDFVTVSGSGFTCADLSSCSTTNLPEGTNLYFTNGRAISALTGQNISIFNNNSGYITSSALTPYLTTANAALTYFPIPTGDTSQYLRGDGSLASFPSIPSVTPSALTKRDDTNVTLTLNGTPLTSLLQSVELQLGWTGTLADSRIASAATWNAKQDALGFTPEDVANKQTDLTASATKYPTVNAVNTGLANCPTLISSTTASNSATIDFTLPSGYNSFEVRCIGVIPVTDAVSFWVRVSTDGGSTFASGASDYIYQRYFQNGSTSVPSLSAADSKIMFLGSAVGNGTGRYLNAIIRVWNPQSSSQYKNITGEVNTYRSDAIYSLGLVNGVYQYNTAINAIRILLSSGNISSGYFELWGYK